MAEPWVAGLLGRVATVEGTMALGGEALRDQQRSRSFRRRVQMVFQDPYGSLHPRHTIDSILSEPARVHGLDRIEQRVVDALEQHARVLLHCLEFDAPMEGLSPVSLPQLVGEADLVKLLGASKA